MYQALPPAFLHEFKGHAIIARKGGEPGNEAIVRSCPDKFTISQKYCLAVVQCTLQMLLELHCREHSAHGLLSVFMLHLASNCHCVCVCVCVMTCDDAQRRADRVFL